ncbi:MAG: S8 family serine peptidase [Thermoplasmata archaeon]
MASENERQRFVSAVVTLAVAVSMLLSGFVIIAHVPDVATGANVDVDAQGAAAPSTNIWMKNAQFDTANGDPPMPMKGGISSYPDFVKGTYIVQKDGPITEEWKADITRAGGEILSYIPDNAFLVRMDNSAKGKVQAVKGNQWMGIYQPAYKIAPELQAKQGTVTVTIDLFQGGNNGPAVRLLKENAGKIISLVNNDQSNFIRAEFDASLMGELASMHDVSWLSEYEQPTYVNDFTTAFAQSGGGTRPIFAKGIQGQNQIAAIADSGVAAEAGLWDSVDHPNFNGMVYGPTGNGPKILAYYVPLGADGQLGDEREAYFHGSHCAGTVLGDGGTYGAYDTATYDGHAYMSQLIFLDIGREDNPLTPDTDESEYVYPPSDYYNILYGQPYANGSRVHSNSWGGGYGYMSEAAQSDRFIWDHEDFVVCFAAGNDGAAYTIGSQAESKNMITVGASSSGTTMASFSSRGPAVDGRIKPDILQNGVGIDSVDGGGTYQSMQGTSMATPGTAGCSLLVRQYYEEGWYPTGTKFAANGFNPSAALVKATLINGATDILGTRPDVNQGWGQIHLDNSLFFEGDARKSFVYDNEQGLVTGDYIDIALGVDTAGPFSVSLVYTDYPGSPTASKQLVNDLNLLVTGPSAVMWKGNNFLAGYSRATTLSNIDDNTNNVEGVRLASAGVGVYVIRVSANNIAYGPQNFALVVSGGLTEGYGKVFMDRTVYDDSDTITLSVEDLNSPAPSVNVVVSSAITGDTETVNILDTALYSGLYKGGTLQTGIGTANPGDNILQVSHGDTITASYEDTNPGFYATTIAWADFHGPIISNVKTIGITGTSAVPTWITDENSDSKVYYRVDGTEFWYTTENANLMINHQIALRDLAENTKYQYYVESTDWRGRSTIDDLGGSYYTFRTTSATAGGALILFVDDDIGSVSPLDGSAFELDWLNNLDSLGWTYTHWDMNILGSPTTADLNQAPMIIWSVAEGYPQLGPYDRVAIEGYLNQETTSAGTIPMALISGQDVGWDMSTAGTEPDPAWLNTYLKAIYNRDDADGGGGDEGAKGNAINPMQVGDIGHVLNDIYDYDAMNLEQDVYGDARFWPDSLTAVAPGVPSWDYEASKVVGDCAAIAQTGGGSYATARIQFQGFAHEMLDSTGSGGNWDPITPIIDPLRKGVLDETIQWLLGGNHPTIDLDDPIGGETITSTTSYLIQWTVAGAESIDVYYSPNSGQEYIKLNGAPLSGAATSYSWNMGSLQDGNTYRVKVVALGTADYATLSDYSESADFTISHDVDTVPPITQPGTIDVSKNPVDALDTVTLTATIDETLTGRNTIAAAQYCVGDTPSWPGTIMYAVDGTFDEITEDVTATLNIGLLAAGMWNKVWVRGIDSKGNDATTTTYVEVWLNGVAAELPPQQPNVIQPSNGLTGVILDPTLQVSVADVNGDTMSVTFHNAAGGAQIGATQTSIPSGGTASVVWNSLSYSTVYNWYAVATDNDGSTQSATWSFTTKAPPQPPNKPALVEPGHNAAGISVNPDLTVTVTDVDGDTMSVTFHNAAGGAQIGATQTNIPSGGTASVVWSDLTELTFYSWYARATDADGTTQSNTWNFTTGYFGAPASPTDLTVEYYGPSGTGSVTTQDRFFRGEPNEVDVNGQMAFSLGMTQSTIGQVGLHLGDKVRVYAGIRVWVRHADETEDELTPGYAVGVGSIQNLAGTVAGLTWTPVKTALEDTDCIVVRLYQGITNPPADELGTFTTARLYADYLDDVAWEPYYYIQSTKWSSYVRWGTTTYNTRIQNFQFSMEGFGVPTDHNTLNWTHDDQYVERYDIYRADTQFGDYTLIDYVPAGGDSTYLDLFKGQFDNVTWWYNVQAVSFTNLSDGNTVNVPEGGSAPVPEAYDITIPGATGARNDWVFVSFAYAFSGNIQDILDDSVYGSSGTSWDVAKGWDNLNKKWLTYRSGYTSTLTTINNQMGVWLHLTNSDGILTTGVTGDYSGSAVEIQLYTGWNMVGYPSATSSLGSTIANADIVSEWQDTTPYVSDLAPGAVTLSEGNAYWVHVTANTLWTVNP